MQPASACGDQRTVTELIDFFCNVKALSGCRSGQRQGAEKAGGPGGGGGGEVGNERKKRVVPNFETTCNVAELTPNTAAPADLAV